jgi:RNA polymerase sigma-70 factor (ECF subfamily)
MPRLAALPPSPAGPDESLTRNASIERAALGTLVVHRDLARHLPSLFAHARRLTRSAVESDDLVQAAVLRALSFARTFEPGTNLKAWLHQVLESVFLSACRRRTRERRALLALEGDPCAWIRSERLPAMCGLSPPVESALARLPGSFAAVVRLVDVDELSYREAATRLDVPLGTVMSRLHRGRRLLAHALAENPARAPSDSAPASAAA